MRESKYQILQSIDHDDLSEANRYVSIKQMSLIKVIKSKEQRPNIDKMLHPSRSELTLILLLSLVFVIPDETVFSSKDAVIELKIDHVSLRISRKKMLSLSLILTFSVNERNVSSSGIFFYYAREEIATPFFSFFSFSFVFCLCFSV